VEIPVQDDTVLRGELRSGGEEWALLAHDQSQDLDAWSDMPNLLGARGLTVLALDLRGHGASDGEPDPASTTSDLARVLEFAAAGGARSVYLGSAGKSAAAALQLAPSPARPLAGLFLLSPALPLSERPPAGVPKLLLVGQGEAGPEELVQVTFGWCLVTRLPTADRGLGLLSGSCGTHAREYILSFLVHLRRGAPAPLRPQRARIPLEMTP
jgi:pimeloyl-ACP methyl ester carboxylesterase